eukprot:TRINITY_DN7288_c0_g1_i2.p1 TRINITY_DN7288_c0_g1~~TRINITY_DN7288_c0_g1_i2.p1  ORF type:complete len:167 (-),score=53.18 TRINITY_DN7288_c0_g1_i2:48-521(-)
MADDEALTLPKSTVGKLVKDYLPGTVRSSNEIRDLISDCCVEFIHLVADQANEVSVKDHKKTIAPQHIIQALRDLGFEHYVSQVQEVYEQHKETLQDKPRTKNKLARLGISEEDLEREQQEYFARAHAALEDKQQQQQQPQATAAPAPADVRTGGDS